MNLDYDMKFGDAFPNLRGVDLATEEFDLPVRIHNILKRCKINTLHELLAYSCNDILNDGGAPWLIDHIVHKLNKWHTRVEHGFSPSDEVRYTDGVTFGEDNTVI